MYKLFLVEDDEAIAGEIRRYLETWDFQVRCVREDVYKRQGCRFRYRLLLTGGSCQRWLRRC